jgi:cytochrome c551
MRTIVLGLSFFLFIGIGCNSNQSDKQKNLASIKDTKVLQYAIEGKNLYELHCANCHQKDGTGLGKLIPPLNPSDYMTEDIGRTARIIKYGLQGAITVNGIIFNHPMPGNPNLTNLEIARILTYIYNIWGNQEGVIDANSVEKFLEQKN